MARKNLNVTELDFDRIKQNLVEYFSRSDSKLKDWNFEGSGLNILLDALAYNTHYNAVTAHMGISETFIDSAQLRENVVSLAKLLGYTPRSAIAPSATINISFTAKPSNSPEEFIIPKGTAFTSSNDGNNYVFLTDDEHVLIRNNGVYSKENVVIRQGFYQTKRYQVDNQRNSSIVTYEIEDPNIDVNSLIVKTFSSFTSVIPDIYTRIDLDVTGIDENSLIYFLTENINGNYQISFGNDIFGKKPENRAIIETTYLVTDGEEANGCSLFKYSGTVPSGINTLPTIETVTPAVGGAEKESIESVRYNAPLSFVTQNRAVTADDYRNLVFKNFPYTQSVSVWGGEDHEPPQYGKVFLSIKPSGADFLNTFQKNEIQTYLKDKKVLSIIPEIIDPEYLQLTLDVFFKYNSNTISESRGEIESNIRALISDYNDNRLQAFDGVFRYSALMTSIDNYHPAILNSHIRVFASKSFTLNPLVLEKKTINFGTELTTDDGKVIIYSSSFRENGLELFFGDESITNNEVERRIYTYYYKNSKKIVYNNDIGLLNLKTGVLYLNEIASDDAFTITLDMMPISNDIVPRRNQLLQIDMNRLFIKGEVDTISTGGISRAIEYKTFQRDR